MTNKTTEEFDCSFGVHIIPGENGVFAALLTQDTKRIFDYEDVKPQKCKDGFRGFVPYGSNNEQPYEILEKIRDDEVMSSNMLFNVNTAYGRGLTYKNSDGSKVTDNNIKKFFRRNNLAKFWLEQFTDLKHFYFSVYVIIMDREGSKILKIRHKEAINCRFEECNDDGYIKNVFYANWKDRPNDEDIEAYPVLDFDDPVGDLLIRLGKEPDPETGKTKEQTKNRIFAIVNRIPTAGEKYYPFPHYCSTFNSGWYTLKQIIPAAKNAKMLNGMSIKYLIELHKDYFQRLFDQEKITDPEKRKERKTKEINNIKNFLSGVDNQDKSWISTYYVDPNKVEQPMIRITRIDKDKQGGDWIEDVEEATNIVSYAMSVHPSLIGSSPGKNKSINGTEARELFTMKQAMERAPRDIMIIPYSNLLNEVNGWDLEFDIPDLMLTTLDQKTDAKEASTKIPDNDDTDDN